MPSTTNDEPYVIYDSIMEDITPVLTTGTLNAGSLANLEDRLTFTTATFDGTAWAGGTDIEIRYDAGAGNLNIVNSFAMSGHTIVGAAGATGGGYYTVTIEYSTDAASWTTAMAVLCYTDRTVVKSWDNSQGYRHWRIVLSDGSVAPTGDIKLAAVAMGERLDFGEYMSQGWDPGRMRTKQNQSRSNTGTFLGNSIAYVEQSIKLRLTQAGLTTEFFHETGLNAADFIIQARHANLPSLDHFLASCYMQGLPHWFSWRNTDKALNATDDYAGHEGQFFVIATRQGSVGTPFLTGKRRRLDLSWDVLVDGFFDHVKAYG